MSGDPEQARVESRGWTAWSVLLRFSRSPVVVYGTYATLLVPLLAHVIVFAGRVWGAVPVQLPDSPAPAPPVETLLPWLGANENPLWQGFAVLFYFGGLLLMVGRLLTDIFCPHRIQRFPYEDDHLLYIGGIKEAKLRIEEALGDDSGEDKEDDPVKSALAGLLRRAGGTAEAINAKWRDENTSRRALRYSIVALYATGTSLVALFLGWRMLDNFIAVTRTFLVLGV